MSETNDAIIDEQFVDISNDEYILQTVEMDKVIDELHLNEEDSIITRSIIDNLEREAADAVDSNIIVSLPYVGNLQRDIIRERMREHNKELQEARASMSKDEYKQFAVQVRKNVKDEILREYHTRKILEKVRNVHKKKYERFVLTRGKHYAELYLKAILWLEAVPFDKDVQHQYDIIAGRVEE